MPIQTLTCPQCARTVTADIPPGSRAQLIHRESGVDVVKVTDRILPTPQGTRPAMPGVPDFIRNQPPALPNRDS